MGMGQHGKKVQSAITGHIRILVSSASDADTSKRFQFR